MLKFTNKQVIEVADWDALVTATYGRPYDFQQQDGCKERQTIDITIPDIAYDYENSTVPEKANHAEMGVSFDAWLERDPKQKLELETNDYDWLVDLWWQRNFYPDVQMIANDLHAKGLIPAGDYSINIDWW